MKSRSSSSSVSFSIGGLIVKKLQLFAFAMTSIPFSVAAVAQSSDQYEYDALGRLVRVQTGQGALTKYEYDKADNRTLVQVQKQFQTSWLATSLSHATGFAEPWGGWAANVTYPVGYMTYGPYTTSVPVGQRTAVWRMMIDVNNTAVGDEVVGIDVYDATADQIITARAIQRGDFSSSAAYQVFELPFTYDTSRAGHCIEFRTLFKKTAYINVERVGYY